MKTTEFLAYLHRLDVQLWAEADRLRYSAPKGTMTPALHAELTARKTDIVAFLHQVQHAADSPGPPMEPVSRHGDLPLSFAQQRLWFLAQLEPHSTVYNVPIACRFTGALHVSALEQSLQDIVRRHEVLRTTFSSVDGQPRQVIAPDIVWRLPLVDLRHLPEPTRQAEVQRLAAAAAQQAFDLAHGPLWRVQLLCVSAIEHVLLWTIHHIVYDGWSHRVFLQELTASYTALATGAPAPLPALPIQYVDFAVWQRQWLRGETLEQHLTYWKKHLDGAPAILDLPTDSPRPAVQTYRGARQSLVLSTGLTAALKALSQREGVTLFMTLLAAFTTWLYRHTDQEDIVVGSPIAGRSRVETEGLLGFFANTLVLRTNVSGAPTYRELLARVRAVCLDAYTHQELPFEKLVEELRPARRRSHTPLFQVMFALQPVLPTALELPGVTLRPQPVESGTAKFDVILFMGEDAAQLQATLEYNTDLFAASTAARMLERLQTLLQGIVTDATQSIVMLPLLPAMERQHVLVAWNATQASYPPTVCLHHLFEAQVERTPHAVAVVDADQHLTYRVLNQRANQLAHFLQSLGVGPDVPVGICMERSAELVIGLLGILKAGGAYVPLDPTYPRERLAFMLADTQASVLVTQQGLRDRLPAWPTEVVCCDTDRAKIAQEPQANPQSEVTAEHLAYVIYTSGSTGQPKGVAIPHRAVNRLVCHTNYVCLGPTDVVAQVANCTFDAATFEIWGALLHGARLVVLTMDVVLSPRDFAAYLGHDGISVLFLTTALFHHLARAVPTAFRTVRTVLFGGEAVEPRWVADILRHGPPVRLLHVYGPTEATTFASWHLVEDVLAGAPTIPIGRPLTHTVIYLLDAYGQPVPIGVPGELYIGGHGVARGYLYRPALTAERFIPHPFSPEPGARLYKTGDLARYQPDGALEFLRRLDQQVKLRGWRVELGEIETALGQHPGVREAVVVVWEASPGDQRLAAYVIPAQSPPPGVDALCSFLLTQLPDYMIPAAWVWLEALPLTPHGKVDRQALPPPDPAYPASARTFVAPRDRLESQLAQIWEQVLGVQPIGVHDNFFRLGGHSLLAARLCARLEKVCRTAIPLAVLFQAPTVAQLAALLRHNGWTAPPSRLLAYRPGGSKPPFFCVHGTELLARYVEAERPFYALHPHALDGQRAPRTIGAMATDYLQDIQAIQSEGPYFLGGGSVGGMVAFELAQQLLQQGQEVALLVLLDPTSPHSGPAAQGNRTRRLKSLGQKMVRMVAELYLQSGRQVPPVLRMPYFLHVSLQAAWDYVPQVYAGRVTLCRAIQGVGDPVGAWKRFVPEGLEVHTVPGDHTTIFQEPHVQILAQHVTAALSKAQGQERSASI